MSKYLDMRSSPDILMRPEKLEQELSLFSAMNDEEIKSSATE